MNGPRLRQAARALVIDEQDRILLARFEFPNDDPHKPPAVLWGVPGGGIDQGETVEEAIARELYEELGLAVEIIGPHLWTRTHLFPYMNGRYDGQRNVVHLLRTEHFEPRPAIGWKQMRAEFVSDLCWWSLDELRAATDVIFAPRAIADIVADLIEHGPPATPLEIEQSRED